jgi:preprotein translocase subunit SecG
MTTFLTILHVLVCLFLILVVLLQAGKGGGMGIAFGGAGSQTVFGSSGAGNFLTRLTSITAVIFLVTSLGLAHYSSQQDSKRLQRLAERKAAEKKVEDERAAKLKTELEKASQSAQPKPAVPGGPAAPESTAPAPTETPAAGKAEPAKTEPAKAGAKKAAATKAKPAAEDGTTTDEEAPKPKRHKRAAAPDTSGAPTPAPAAPAAPPASE